MEDFRFCRWSGCARASICVRGVEVGYSVSVGDMSVVGTVELAAAPSNSATSQFLVARMVFSEAGNTSGDMQDLIEWDSMGRAAVYSDPSDAMEEWRQLECHTDYDVSW
jgi:hypothetical protein